MSSLNAKKYDHKKDDDTEEVEMIETTHSTTTQLEEGRSHEDDTFDIK